ncbi:15745_t:CDS:2 [Funneliformis geosporum]|uniref:15745_t:CDS:1 n=1 Tax=Funneliformis geosporum TaxID=1117311 RepID=A0A9W4SYA1_9GLOM|nr:15745_t:CDS:2 [Funneliformis geosporum]
MVAIKFLCTLLIIATAALVTIVDAFDPQLMLKLVNNERKKAGVPELTLDSKLTKAAQKQTDFMVSTDNLTHDNPAGSLGKRIQDAGYKFSNVGENIAKGFGTNEEVRVMDVWMKSSGHRANILNKAFTNLGVGFGGGKYWTQDFGRRSRSTRKSKRNVTKPARLIEN